MGTAMSLSFDQYALGVDTMDDMHHEYLMLFESLISSDDRDFIHIFDIYLDHVRRHFTNENILMEKSGFPATDIHQGEHSNVLERLEELYAMANNNQIIMVRTWMERNMPVWFISHLRSMDNALANHLKTTGITSNEGL